MWLNLLKTFLILFLVFSFAGCATTKDVSVSELEEGTFPKTTLAVTAKLRFSDMPVPVGFKLIKDESFVFQNGGTRVALLKYAGRAQLQDLIDFYKEQMPQYSWELLNILEYGRSILNFARSKENCIVAIESKGAKKIIIISVSPKAKQGMEAKTSK